MPARRIAIVGAGSAYMPGVIRGLLARAGDLAGSELALYDLDAGRLELMRGLAARMIAAAGADLEVRAERALRPALEEADFVFTSFRPGGMHARHLDESIPLRHGGARIIGLCDQHVGDLELWARLLRLPAERVEADWLGLNHATWAERLRVDGTDLGGELGERLERLEPPAGADLATRQLVELARALGLLPNSYARYYYFHDDVLAELGQTDHPRP